MCARRLHIPDTLNIGPIGLEELYALITDIPTTSRFIFDMKRVRQVEPCGIIALLSLARHCTISSGNRVILINLQESVYTYLNQINLFNFAEQWLTTIGYTGNNGSNALDSRHVIELVKIHKKRDVETTVDEVEGLFSPIVSGLGAGSLLSLVSELCANIYEHSQDPNGLALIYGYCSENSDQVIIRLAVGDIGCGVPASIYKWYGKIGDEPIDYMRAAIGVATSRETRKGGYGLPRVQEIVAEYKGYLCLRSGTAALTYCDNKWEERKYLNPILGTQVSIEIHMGNEN